MSGSWWSGPALESLPCPPPRTVQQIRAEQRAREQQAHAERYAVEFDYRSDSGPRLVGPFDTREQADAYVRALHLDGSEYSVCPLAHPDSSALTDAADG